MNFFLEGPIQIGKSTLLREELLPHQNQVAGMMVQRLFEGGEKCGYRACVVRGALPALEASYAPGLKGVFLYKGVSRPEMPVSVIEDALAACKEAACRLILLDEIGGVELLDDRFMATLYQILGLGKPCCGVVKSADNLARTARRLSLPPGILARGEALRQTLQRDGALINCASHGPGAVRAPLAAFLAECLGHDE